METKKHDNIFAEQLRDAVEDERSDVEKYMKLGAWAEEHYPGKPYAGILFDIAREENTHKKHLKEILHDMGFTEDDIHSLEPVSSESAKDGGDRNE